MFLSWSNCQCHSNRECQLQDLNTGLLDEKSELFLGAMPPPPIVSISCKPSEHITGKTVRCCTEAVLITWYMILGYSHNRCCQQVADAAPFKSAETKIGFHNSIFIRSPLVFSAAELFRSIKRAQLFISLTLIRKGLKMKDLRSLIICSRFHKQGRGCAINLWQFVITTVIY